MAVKTELVCDFDSTQNEDVQTVLYSVGDVDYTVDLSVYAREALAKALEPFVKVSTVVEKKKAKTSSGPLNADIREWAKQNGLAVSERGRISDEIINAYASRDAKK